MKDEDKTKDQLIRELNEVRAQMENYQKLDSEKRMTEQCISRRLEFERIVSTISTRFVGTDCIDSSISDSLKLIGMASNADRAYLFQYRKDGSLMTNTHEWCAQGITPEIDNLQDLPSHIFPWWNQQLEQGAIIHIADVDSMPKEASAEHDILSRQGIRSLVVLPVRSGDSLRGFIGFDDMAKTGEWSPSDIAILRTVSEIIGNAFDRKHAEGLARTERERAENYFDMAPVFMLALDPDGVITNINHRGCEILCEERENLMNRNWFADFVPLDVQEEIMAAFGRLLTGNIDSIDYLESPVLCCGGEERVIAWHISAIRGEDGETIGTLSSGEDVTDRKATDERMKRRLMKYNLQDGRLYIVKEISPVVSMEAFTDLLKLNYRGVVISRTSEEELTSDIPERCTFFWLAEMDNGNTIAPQEPAIEKILEEQKAKTVILIDRIEYVISKIGFKRTLECIQRLRELCYIRGFIIIISIDPLTLKREELRLLEKEGLDVEAYEEIILPENLSDVLNLVHRQNVIGLKPSYSFIGKELGISKPTMRKRIATLINGGYLKEDSVGRMKIVELAEKGKLLFRS